MLDLFAILGPETSVIVITREAYCNADSEESEKWGALR